MKALEITTQINCNVRCEYCPQEKLVNVYKKRSHIKQMSFEIYKKCIDKLPKQVEIRFTGMCEPWLNPFCTQMVNYALDNGHSVGGL